MRGDIVDLPADPATLESEVKGLVTKAEEIMQKCNTMPRGSYNEMATNIQRIDGEVTELEVKVNDQVASMDYKKGQASADNRKQYLHTRWQVTKLFQKMTAGHFGVENAKFMSECSQPIMMKEIADDGSDNIVLTGSEATMKAMSHEPKLADFERLVLTSWSLAKLGDDFGFLKELAASLAAEPAQQKVKSLNEKMKEETTWAGAWGVASSHAWPAGELSLGGEPLLHTDMFGAKPWAIACRDGRFRAQPAGVPLAGMACLIVTDKHPVWIHGMWCKHILAQGISLKDHTSFFETTEGAKSLKKDGWAVRLPPHHILYVPNGAVCICTFLLRIDAKAPTSKKQEFVDWGICWHIPVAIKAWQAELPEAVRTAVVAWNTEFLASKGGNAMWKQRREWFDKCWV